MAQLSSQIMIVASEQQREGHSVLIPRPSPRLSITSDDIFNDINPRRSSFCHLQNPSEAVCGTYRCELTAWAGADRPATGADWPERFLRATMSRSCWSSRGFNFHVLRFWPVQHQIHCQFSTSRYPAYSRLHCEKETAIMFSGLQNPRNIAAQIMNFGLVLSTAFMVRCDPACA